MKKRFPLLIRWLLALTFLTRIALAFRPEVKLTERPYQDDAYYTLTCSYHFAEGHGITADGIHPTNGVQPLIIPVYAFFFLLSSFDKWLGVRLTIIFAAFVECSCVYALYRLILLMKIKNDSSDKFYLKPEFIAPIMWAVLFEHLRLNDSGLETGLYAAFILSSMWYYCKLKWNERNNIEPSFLQWVFFGIILGMLVLTRIDGAIFIISFAIIDTMFRKKTFMDNITPALIFSITALFISTPWWIYNYSMFGNIIPISGLSESLDISVLSNIKMAVIDLRNIILTFIYIPYYLNNTINITFLISLVLIVSYILLRIDIFRSLKKHYLLIPLYPLFFGGISLSIYYIFFFGAPHFIERYIHPLRIAWMISFALAFPFIQQRGSEFLQQHFHYRKFISFLAAIILTGIIIFNIGSYVLNFTTSKSSQAYHIGVWALAHPQEKIGLASSGTAGFMADNIVNLDGKVNFDALQARKEHRMGEYIVKSGITILTDWDYISNAAQIKAYGSDFVPIDTVSGAGIYKRIK